MSASTGANPVPPATNSSARVHRRAHRERAERAAHANVFAELHPVERPIRQAPALDAPDLQIDAAVFPRRIADRVGAGKIGGVGHPDLDVLTGRELAEAFAGNYRREAHDEDIRRGAGDVIDAQLNDTIGVRRPRRKAKIGAARDQIVLDRMAHLRAPFEGEDGLDRRERDGVRRTGVCTGRASHHAVERIDDHRLLAVEIEAIDHAAAAGDTGAAADARILDDTRIPVDLFARHAVPRPGELRIRHDGSPSGHGSRFRQRAGSCRTAPCRGRRC